jgi:hypothetical protein
MEEFLPHSEQRQDHKWKKKRMRILKRDRFRCQCCGEKTNQLQVHHRWYVSGRHVWEYPDVALVTLCKECHDLERKIGKCTARDGLDWEVLSGWLFYIQNRFHGWGHHSNLEKASREFGMRCEDVFFIVLFALGNGWISKEMMDKWESEFYVHCDLASVKGWKIKHKQIETLH